MSPLLYRFQYWDDIYFSTHIYIFMQIAYFLQYLLDAFYGFVFVNISQIPYHPV